MLYKQMRSSLTLIGFSVPTDVTLTLVLIKSQSAANLGTIKTEVEVNFVSSFIES